MKGIDISNWQGGLNLWNLDVDFAIMKATEGLGFVDSYCDGWVTQAKDKGIKWGFYHFANANDPVAEADFFVDNCANYFREGVPVLDIEDFGIPVWGEYSDVFINRVHERTGVYPIIYTSAANLPRFEGYETPEKCGLWLAGYPYPATWWTDDNCPYGCWPWGAICIWQFTSSLRLDGYDGNLDGNVSYIEPWQWDMYANPDGESNPQPTPAPSYKSIDDMAHEVIIGEWGNGEDRERMISEAGYDYPMIQERVDEIYNVAESVIRGDWGNGEYRKSALENSGYRYDTVQHVVNTLLG